jgi:dTDP-4-amino-4,6-dideoxygalactose transaminase
MTELQGTLGLSQMKRLDAFVARRRQLAAQYDTLLADVAVQLPAQRTDTASSWHLYVVRVPAQIHVAVFDALRAAGIGVNLHYIPVHTQPYYRAMGFEVGQFPQSEAYYAEAISIPLYAGLSDEDQLRVVAELTKAVAARA